MKEILKETIKNINDSTYINIINKIKSINDLDNLIKEFTNNISNLDLNKIEPILKIILTKLVSFNGDINKNYTQQMYDKLKSSENPNIMLVDNFITHSTSFKSHLNTVP